MQPNGGAVESRMWSVARNEIGLGSSASESSADSIFRSKRSIAVLPISEVGWAIVVNLGRKLAAQSKSSNPKTLTCSGQETPHSVKARIKPRVILLLQQKMAVGGSARRNSSSPLVPALQLKVPMLDVFKANRKVCLLH